MKDGDLVKTGEIVKILEGFPVYICLYIDADVQRIGRKLPLPFGFAMFSEEGVPAVGP